MLCVPDVLGIVVIVAEDERPHLHGSSSFVQATSGVGHIGATSRVGHIPCVGFLYPAGDYGPPLRYERGNLE